MENIKFGQLKIEIHVSKMLQYLIKSFCLLAASYLSGWHELDVCRQTTERPESERTEEAVSSKNGS
jgi:hypothetical protein